MSTARRRQADAALDTFEAERPRLVGLAYRMLGTVGDAEDVVQDAWLRWSAVEPDDIDNPPAWLTTVTARLALDRLRSARHRREQYVGPWLPEPVVTDPGPDEAVELAESLTLGFLHLLDQLGPVERVVFLLADVMGHPYREVAAVVDRSETACRQIASRARRRLRRVGPVRAPRRRDRQAVAGLLSAVLGGDVDGALAHLAPDVVLTSDGGRDRRAARRPVVGAQRVARFLLNLAKRYVGAGFRAEAVTLNGDPGVLLTYQGRPDVAVAFETEQGRVVAIWMVRNPAKLGRLREPVALA